MPAPLSGAYRFILRLARVCAVLGGIVLLAMACMTTVSVISRAVANTPIFGIFELVELFTGIAVLSFFPYTHITRGNVVAEFFTNGAPAPVRHGLEFLADLTFLAIACFALRSRLIKAILEPVLFAVSSLRGAICVGLFVGIRTVPYSCVRSCAVWPQHVVFLLRI